MKKMRKFLSALLAVSMVFAVLATWASAAAPAATSVEKLAHTDTATASPAQREKILDARRQIVYGDQAWTVNGAMSLVREDGTLEPLPEFSDLWPDWDLDEISGLTPDPFAGLPGSSVRTNILFDKTILLPAQSGTRNAPTFYRFNANGKPVYAWMFSMDRIYRCNIGFNNEDTGEDLGWYPSLAEERQVHFNTESGVRYGVRASAAGSTKANARMIVSEDPNHQTSIQG